MTKLTVDFNASMSSQLGAVGLERRELEVLFDRARAAHDTITTGRREGKIAFMDLPGDLEAARAAKLLGQKLTAFENLIVLGIGGSSLGAKALVSALCDPQHNQLPASRRKGARIFFQDNSDPRTFGALLRVLDPAKTAIAAITKSGGTAETWAQLLIARQWLSAASKDPSKQIVAITDPKKGALRQIAEAQGWQTLPVPPPVGGRFSVLSSVGLLPAAAAGIEIDQLLGGAAAMARRCEEPELLKNPAYLFAATLYLMDRSRGRPIHVFMPYADGLRETADWFVQLWAESLGKRLASGEHVGPTPLRAVGATDQHSLLQLLMEGPQDKVVCFVVLDEPQADLEIPKAFEDQPDVAYLGGHGMHGLISAECRATSSALAAAARPSLTIRLPRLDARSMGELIMLLEVATAFAGPLYGVDPYDQPGVEAGKRYACGLLGRPGYEGAKKELEQRPAPSAQWVL